MSEMRPLGKLISLEDALEICDSAAVPTDRIAMIKIEEAVGRVLAEDVISEINVPPFDKSAMDGYAVRHEDVRGASEDRPATLSVVEKILAGDILEKRISRMECTEIATGAMLPEGADTVVMVEHTSEATGNRVSVSKAPEKGRDVISTGDDIRTNDRIAAKGDLLSPGKIGAIAAIGRDEINVYRRPRAVIMPTGDEIVRPGEKLERGQIFDINTFTLSSAIEIFGGDCSIEPIVEDTKQGILNAIEKEHDADIIIFSGGSSVGEKDLVIDAINEIGELLFHGVAIKPGKPTILGRVGKSLVLGMPGHPTSCLSNSYIFLEPMIGKIGRFPRKRAEEITLRLSKDIRSPRGKAQILTVKVDGDYAVPVFKESSAITSMTNADGYVIVPQEIEQIEKDSEITVRLF